MRTERLLALCAATGLLAGALSENALAGLPLSPGGFLTGGLLGACWGAGIGTLLLASDASPLLTVAILLALAPLGTGIEELSGVAGIGTLPLLLCLVPAVALVRRPEMRAALPPNLLTAAVAVYALFALCGLRGGSPQAIFMGASAALLPLALYVLGLLLPVRIPPPGMDAPQQQLTRLERQAREHSFHVFLWVALGCACGLALIAEAAACFTGAAGTPARATLPDATTLAHLLGLALVLALTWDSGRLLWRVLLGAPPAAAPAFWRIPLVRVALAVAAALALPALTCALALTQSRTALVATICTLLWAALLRRRLGTLPLAGFAVLPFFLLPPHGLADLLSSPFAHVAAALARQGWPGALGEAELFPLGSGLAALGSGASAHTAQYVLTLQTLGLPGFTALLAVLAIALFRAGAVYRRLRPLSGEAGIVLAGGSAMLFLLLASFTASPLAEPVTGAFFWLLLGLLQRTLTALDSPQPQTAEPEALRSTPLRITYLADGGAPASTANALLDLFRAQDRRQVTPSLVVLGSSPLANAARSLEVSCAEVTRVAPLRPGAWLRVRPWLRVLLTLPHSAYAIAAAERLARALSWLAEEAGTVRAVLELRPDLVVSTGPYVHIAAFCAGRIAGVPVQWHTREAAPARLQSLLDALLPWTAGVVADSQAVARSFPLETLRALVKVVRPGILLPAPVSEVRAAVVRQSLGVADAAPLLVCDIEPSHAGGPADILRAVARLSARYPRLHLLLVSERISGGYLPGTDAPEEAAPLPLASRLARLRQTVALSGLDDIVTVLGERTDVGDLLAVADVAVSANGGHPATRSLLLALAQGTPLVATDAGGNAELLADAWGYVLAPAGDAEGLARAIEHVLDALPEYRTSARRNPGLIRDWYTTSLEAGRLQSLYTRICLPSPALLSRWKSLLIRRAAPFPAAWLAALRTSMQE